MYKWVTYPLTALLDSIWQKANTDGQPKRNSIDAYTLEVVACAERALNYLHTGNPRVILRTVMNPLWIGEAIIHDGLPCFNPEIVVVRRGHPVKVFLTNWPCGGALGMHGALPYSAARSVVEFNYGQMDYHVSISIISF